MLGDGDVGVDYVFGVVVVVVVLVGGGGVVDVM